MPLLVVLNPAQKHIVLTKSFKKTVLLKQVLKLAYVSMFSVCVCRELSFSTPTNTLENEADLKILQKSFRKSKHHQQKFNNASIYFLDRSTNKSELLMLPKETLKKLSPDYSLDNYSSNQSHPKALVRSNGANFYVVPKDNQTHDRKSNIIQQILNFNTRDN